MNSSNLFQEVQSFNACSLRPVETNVTMEDGQVFLEKKDKKGCYCVTKKGRKHGFVADFSEDHDASLIIPGLIMGSQDVAKNLDLLHKFGVTHVINLATGVPNYYESQFAYKRIKILDLPEVKISSFFDECFNFIDKGRKVGCVLVHCNVGISRSATIVIGYLMRKERKKLNDAIDTVKAARPYIRPNDGFLTQLAEYEKELFGND